MGSYKRKPDQERFPHEFIVPYSLDECLSRLPPGSSHQILPRHYEFSVQPNIIDKQNQFIGVQGYLEAETESTTLIYGKGTMSPLFYLLLVVSVPFFVFIAAGMLGATGIGFIACVNFVIYYALYRDKSRLAEAVFEVFQPISKTKRSEGRRMHAVLLPSVPLNLTVDVPLNEAAIRLRQLSFLAIICYVRAVKENEYRFHATGLTGRLMGVQSLGSLKHITPYSTEINARVGCGYMAYFPLAVMLLMGLFLAVHDRPWLLILPIAAVVFPLFYLINGLISIYSLRRTLRQTLVGSAGAKRKRGLFG